MKLTPSTLPPSHTHTPSPHSVNFFIFVRNRTVVCDAGDTITPDPEGQGSTTGALHCLEIWRTSKNKKKKRIFSQPWWVCVLACTFVSCTSVSNPLRPVCQPPLPVSTSASTPLQGTRRTVLCQVIWPNQKTSLRRYTFERRGSWCLTRMTTRFLCFTLTRLSLFYLQCLLVHIIFYMAINTLSVILTLL